jgi:hypothetical protein
MIFRRDFLRKLVLGTFGALLLARMHKIGLTERVIRLRRW